MSKLKKRLKLLDTWASPQEWLDSLEVSRIPLRNGATDFERAHVLLGTCGKKGRLALASDYADHSAVSDRARDFTKSAVEFFFGDWREKFIHPEGGQRTLFWKRRFEWMDVFELCLLWASALSDWSELSKVGAFPEPDSYVDFSHKEHDRDLLLAIGAFCAARPAPVVTSLLEKSIGGRSQKCRLAAEALKAILAGDNAAVSKSLVKYMKYHESKEFPKADMLCKISILGTILFT